jgi:hypothetical protein
VWSHDSKAVKAAGERLGIWYVHEIWDFPVLGPEYVGYLNAIGVKASDSAGWYEVRDGSVVIFVMLKNLRWTHARHRPAARLDLPDSAARMDVVRIHLQSGAERRRRSGR